jgi:hypothetical protein
MTAALSTDLVLAASVLERTGHAHLADAVAQAAKALAGAACIDCGGSVLGGRSLRCAACRHTHRVAYQRRQYLARKGKAA